MIYCIWLCICSVSGPRADTQRIRCRIRIIQRIVQVGAYSSDLGQIYGRFRKIEISEMRPCSRVLVKVDDARQAQMILHQCRSMQQAMLSPPRRASKVSTNRLPMYMTCLHELVTALDCREFYTLRPGGSCERGCS